MNRKEMLIWLEKYISLSDGLLATEIASLPEFDNADHDIPSLLAELVGSNRILEVRFWLRETSYKSKIWFFPKETTVWIGEKQVNAVA